MLHANGLPDALGGVAVRDASGGPACPFATTGNAPRKPGTRVENGSDARGAAAAALVVIGCTGDAPAEEGGSIGAGGSGGTDADAGRLENRSLGSWVREGVVAAEEDGGAGGGGACAGVSKAAQPAGAAAVAAGEGVAEAEVVGPGVGASKDAHPSTAAGAGGAAGAAGSAASAKAAHPLSAAGIGGAGAAAVSPNASQAGAVGGPLPLPPPSSRLIRPPESARGAAAAGITPPTDGAARWPCSGLARAGETGRPLALGAAPPPSSDRNTGSA
jgi:hypothetical protein